MTEETKLKIKDVFNKMNNDLTPIKDDFKEIGELIKQDPLMQKELVDKAFSNLSNDLNGVMENLKKTTDNLN